MSNPKQKISNKSFYTILAVIVVLVLSAVTAYGTNSRDAVSRFFKTFYPAAVIGGNFVSVDDWEENMAIAEKLDPSGSKQAAGQALIDSIKKEAVFDSLKLKASPEQINQEFQYERSDSAADYNELIQKYFSGDGRKFIKYVVLPNFYDAQLRIKYNSDTKTNATSYNRAKNLLNRIANGESFEEVAKAESEDEVTAQIGGDLGVVSASEILPELSEALKTSTVGEVKKDIVASRLGYHILYPQDMGENNGQQVWHLKHILVQTAGYDKWIAPKMSEVSVWRVK